MENQSPYDSPFLKPEVPNASSAQLLGIISIVFSFLFTLAGLVLGIVAVVQARKAEETYNANPQMYNPFSLNKARTGRTTGIVGIVISSLSILIVVAVLIIVFTVYTRHGHSRCY